MLHLRVDPNEDDSFDRDLNADSVTVGRSERADLTVPDRFLSRKHARVFRLDGEWWVEDLGSRNGTRINDQVIEKPTKLEIGDQIRLCNSLLTLMEPGSGAGGGRLVSGDKAMSLHTQYHSVAELIQPQETQLAPTLESLGALQKKSDRLELLNELHRALGHSIEQHELLDLILERAFDELQPEEAVIFLKSPDGSYECAAQRSAAGAETDYLYSETLVREVAEKGMAALVTDAKTDPTLGPAASIIGHGVRSLVAAPLLDAKGSLGMIVLNSSLKQRHFEREDMELLVSLASIAALRIRNVVLAEEAAREAAERQRLESELAFARQIQVALIPAELPEIEGYELLAENEPSRGVSGDYYQMLEQEDGGRAFLIADVSGKGMAASILTATLEALATGPIESGRTPAEVCTRVSRRLYERTLPSKYATLFLVILDAPSGGLCFTNAGHNPALVIRSDGDSELLEGTGPPVGLWPAGEYEEGAAKLGPGDLLVLYTDGLSEAANPDDDEFGVERLIEVCSAHRSEQLEQISEAIEEALRGFAAGVPFADDRTFVLVRRKM